MHGVANISSWVVQLAPFDLAVIAQLHHGAVSRREGNLLTWLLSAIVRLSGAVSRTRTVVGEGPPDLSQIHNLIQVFACVHLLERDAIPKLDRSVRHGQEHNLVKLYGLESNDNFVDNNGIELLEFRRRGNVRGDAVSAAAKLLKG